MVKSVIMGGCVCGVASSFLRPAINSSQEVEKQIQQLEQGYRTAQFLLGAADFKGLFLNSALIQKNK